MKYRAMIHLVPCVSLRTGRPGSRWIPEWLPTAMGDESAEARWVLLEEVGRERKPYYARLEEGFTILRADEEE
ncbi:hypothetical protein LCGC14_0427790 [marine sediment metagenome]|uniref:Uncharacterized protein n=1 Tax=marine sediment metagenome TaxID=412755 RepID=A0A0F9SVF0_9ZZZZ